MAAICSGASLWFTGASAAPTSPQANRLSRNAGWFGPSQATRLPRRTPSRVRAYASRRTRSASSAYVSERPAPTTAGWSGLILARRSIHEPTEGILQASGGQRSPEASVGESGRLADLDQVAVGVPDVRADLACMDLGLGQ